MNLYRVISSILHCVSIICFGLGLYFPILTSKVQIMGLNFRQEYINIFSSIQLFFNTGDYLIAIIIFLFTIIAPIAKYCELTYKLLVGPPVNDTKTIILLQNIDKWNMLDVFVVALLLLNFKMQDGWIVMDMSLGSLFIALAVITRMLTIIILAKSGNSSTPKIEDKL